MIWNELKQRICFEDSLVCIEWGTKLNKLKKIGEPQVLTVGGKIQIVWKNMSLLEGIKGDWMVSTFPPNDMKQPFKSIHVNYVGDKEANETYLKIKQHLVSLVGEPSYVNEDGQSHEIKWLNGQHYIHLYLFEMHAFRCVLTIGID